MYWSAPLPADFDPVPRPLSWTGSRSNPSPSAVDQEIFGTNDDNFVPGFASRSFIIGGRGQTPVLFRQGSSAQDRQATYAKLVSLRAKRDVATLGDGPDDPDAGGLPADELFYNLSGMFAMHYFDFSDAWPKRKFVLRLPGGNPHVRQWDPDRQAWGDEGFDAEKDFRNALPSIIAAFGGITTAAVGYLTANPELAAVWGSVFKEASSAVFGGPAPNLASFAGLAVSAFGTMPGFGQAMGNAIVGDGVKQGLFGEVGKIAFGEIADIGKSVSTHLDRIKAAVEKAADAFPHVDLSAMANATLPPDVLKAADNAAKGLSSFDLFSYQKAAFAVANKLEDQLAQDLLFGIRKACPDKGTFDTTLASALATQKKSERAKVESVSVIQYGKPAQVHSDEAALADLDALVKTLETRYHLR